MASEADSMRAERDELLVALKEVKAENERLRGSSRDHDPSIGSALNEDLRNVADDLREWSRSLADAEWSAKIWRPPYEFALRIEAALSRARPGEGSWSRDEVKPSPAKAENR